jgi:redox-sensitive bicupin YhaK (pirin superfamily)
MKKILFPANDRGFANHGWLKSYHTFSFANFHNPNRMNFGALRVVNDDNVAASMGFGRHQHANMEIVSIPLSGSLQHEDSEGNKAVINHGDIQIMSAGTGIFHAEKNNSNSEEVKFFQIWVFPKFENIKPNYDQKTFLAADRHNKFQIVVSPDNADGGVHINQESVFYLGNFDKDSLVTFKKKFDENSVFLMVIEGEIDVAGEKLNRRDAIGISDFEKIDIKSLTENTQLLVIEVPE